MKRVASAIFMAMLLTSMLYSAFKIMPAGAIGTIYIRADGSIDPPTAPVQRDGSIYTFTDNVYGAIVVQRANIVVDGSGYTLQGIGGGEGISLMGIENVSVRNMQIKDFTAGAYLGGSPGSSIEGNNITANIIGINLFMASNISITGNNITANGGVGINLLLSSNNSISGNSIIANIDYVIFMADSSSNSIFHNSFINNTIYQVYSYNSVNVWNYGYPSGGNYWSDFNPPDVFSGPYQNETGSDKIGDAPYIVDANNTDNYPLIYPNGYVPGPDFNNDGIIDIFDLVRLALAYGSMPGMPNWDPYVDLNQDGTIDIFDIVVVALRFGGTG